MKGHSGINECTYSCPSIPSKVLFFRGEIWISSSYMVPQVHLSSQCRRRHYDRFSRFSTVHARPRAKWTDQLRRDNNNVPIATLWRQANGRGHSRATLRSEPTTRQRRRRLRRSWPTGRRTDTHTDQRNSVAMGHILLLCNACDAV